MQLELNNGRKTFATQTVRTLWLVDDNAEFRQLLAELFSRHADIDCARQFDSAEAVLEALETEAAPDVILSDLRMGRMSGAEAVAPIKRCAPGTHVVLLTTFYDAHAALVAHQAGAAGFLLKHHAFEEILAFIRKIIVNPPTPPSRAGEWFQPAIVQPAHASGFIKQRPVAASRTGWERGRQLVQRSFRSALPAARI